jgi:hypothetical protein
VTANAGRSTEAVIEQDVILRLQLDELRSRDRGGEQPSLRERDDRVFAPMNDERLHAHVLPADRRR